MKNYEIFWFGIYYSVTGKEHYDLIKANIKSLRKLYTRDSFALHRFIRGHGIQLLEITSSPRKTLKRA